MRKSAFQLIKDQKKKQADLRKKELSSNKITTKFNNGGGANKLDSLEYCPICKIRMVETTVTTEDGREIPINYCLQHAIALPLPLDNKVTE